MHATLKQKDWSPRSNINGSLLPVKFNPSNNGQLTFHLHVLYCKRNGYNNRYASAYDPFETSF